MVDADVAAKAGWFLSVGFGLLAVGLLLVAGGVVVIVVAARRSSRRPATGVPRLLEAWAANHPRHSGPEPITRLHPAHVALALLGSAEYDVLAGPVANSPGRRSGSTPTRDQRDEATHY